MKGVTFLSKMVYKMVRGWTMLQSPLPPPPSPGIKFCSVLFFYHGRPLPPKIQSSQIAQTKRKWSSDELQIGSKNKEMIILKIK